MHAVVARKNGDPPASRCDNGWTIFIQSHKSNDLLVVPRVDRDVVQESIAESGKFRAERIDGTRTNGITGNDPTNKSGKQENHYDQDDPTWIHVKAGQHKGVGDTYQRERPGQCEPDLAPLSVLRAKRHTYTYGLAND